MTGVDFGSDDDLPNFASPSSGSNGVTCVGGLRLDRVYLLHSRSPSCSHLSHAHTLNKSITVIARTCTLTPITHHHYHHLSLSHTHFSYTHTTHSITHTTQGVDSTTGNGCPLPLDYDPNRSSTQSLAVSSGAIGAGLANSVAGSGSTSAVESTGEGDMGGEMGARDVDGGQQTHEQRDGCLVS